MSSSDTCAWALAKKSEQDVLGLNREAAELNGLIAAEEEHASRAFGVAFEHGARRIMRGSVLLP
jgi:hypothetical protein